MNWKHCNSPFYLNDLELYRKYDKLQFTFLDIETISYSDRRMTLPLKKV